MGDNERRQGESAAVEGQLAVFVSSCDAYSDLWTPFFTLFHAHWPDCPFEIFLGTNLREWRSGQVRVVRSGDDLSWADSFRAQLRQIPHEYVLILLEDFFFRRHVKTSDVVGCLERLIRLDGHVVYLTPRPRARGRQSDLGLASVSLDQPYRLSLQSAIWRRETLLKLLAPGESAWQFELNGTQRSRQFETGFYSARANVIPYRGLLVHHVVERGKWFPHQAWQFGRMGIGCQFDKRGVLRWSETARYHCAVILSRTIEALPPAIRRLLDRTVRSRVAHLLGSSGRTKTNRQDS